MELHVLELWLPILLSGVAIFFASFLSWMVLQLHEQDWQRLKREDEFLAGVRGINPPNGSFMFPRCEHPKDMQSEEFQKKWKDGPRGIVTFFPETNMGTNLALTMLLFIAVNFTLAYLGTIAFRRGEEFITIFRFFATASLLVYLTGILQHAIWFKARVVGHIIESIAYALIAGAIFAALWPAAESSRTTNTSIHATAVAAAGTGARGVSPSTPTSAEATSSANSPPCSTSSS